MPSETQKEKSLEKKIEKDLEGKVERKLEKDVEKKVEKKIEKELETEVKKLGKERAEVSAIGERTGAMQKSSISVHVDRYSFIFSDFDPRPFSQRILSEDFLREVKRFALETRPGMLELRFLVPESQRSAEMEAVIKKRLHDHFKNQSNSINREKSEIIRNGIILGTIGFGALAVATFISYSSEISLFKTALIVALEPLGWFSFWFALDNIFYGLKEKKPETEFNDKMSKADILFESY